MIHVCIPGNYPTDARSGHLVDGWSMHFCVSGDYPSGARSGILSTGCDTYYGQ
ncbi:MAG: hypothetical protein OSJ41_04655 [Duncaniella sp.]|nr:hypothetical protein [Duncaniella sp.]